MAQIVFIIQISGAISIVEMFVYIRGKLKVRLPVIKVFYRDNDQYNGCVQQQGELIS